MLPQIQYGWIKNLLPRVHEADVVNLTGRQVSRGESNESQLGNRKPREGWSLVMF